ncbi:MAG TPA: metal-dependent hydrolase [Pelomicrobium sp.]|nr:metal-dependent hydrolase [Pelomicrobium sp.]
MPTVFTHPAVPLALAAAGGPRAVPAPLLAFGIACSVAPDLDVFAPWFGFGWGSFFSHRGFTHTLGFALMLAALAAALHRPLRASPRAAFAFVFVCAWSHPLLDAFTDGGRGIPLLWPLSDERYFLPVRMLEVSPLGLRFFTSGRAMDVLRSEIVWVWLPLAAVVSIGLLARRIGKKQRS